MTYKLPEVHADICVLLFALMPLPFHVMEHVIEINVVVTVIIYKCVIGSLLTHALLVE